MITIVDYGLGNIQAFVTIYKRLNIAVAIARTTDELARAEKIILPGVGAFDWAMSRLDHSGMRACLDRLVKVEKRPILGVCVGMQIMADCSDEGTLPGLSWIAGEVKRFEQAHTTDDLRLPHMGWNDVLPQYDDCLFAGIEADARFYFLHSYYFRSVSAEHILAYTEFHGAYTSAVRSDNVYGVQFHPEKSHQWGIRLLKNFAEM